MHCRKRALRRLRFALLNAATACFPAGLLAGLESCHRIGCGAVRASITDNTVARLINTTVCLRYGCCAQSGAQRDWGPAISN